MFCLLSGLIRMAFRNIAAVSTPRTLQPVFMTPSKYWFSIIVLEQSTRNNEITKLKGYFAEITCCIKFVDPIVDAIASEAVRGLDDSTSLRILVIIKAGRN